MSQWLGYFIDDDGESVPVATGGTHEEAQAKAIRRVLSAGITVGGIGVREHPALSAGDFAKVGKTVDDFHAARGIA